MHIPVLSFGILKISVHITFETLYNNLVDTGYGRESYP